MRITRRRALTGMAGATGLAILAACGEEEADAPAAAAPAAPAPAAPTDSGADTAADTGDQMMFEDVEIEFRFNGLNPAGQEAARTEIAKFKDLTGIQVKPDFSDWASSFQKITTGFAAQSAPDIWYGGGCGPRYWPPRARYSK